MWSNSSADQGMFMVKLVKTLPNEDLDTFPQVISISDNVPKIICLEIVENSIIETCLNMNYFTMSHGTVS